MLTLLSTVKTRLGIPELDITQDALLAAAIAAVSARFDLECGRRLVRTADLAQEFDAGLLDIVLRCSPLESVSRFEWKLEEADGWEVCADPGYLARGGVVLSLRQALGRPGELARVIYTGGFVAPGSAPGPGQWPLPVEIEWAATEQVAAWHLNRDKLGLIRQWLHQGTYAQIAQDELIPSVRGILARYRRARL